MYVADEMFRPYILLKDIDGNPYWRPYGGESIEDIRKFHKWELDAQKEFKDNARSPEDLDELRNIVFATNMFLSFFGFSDDDPDFAQQMFGELVHRIAKKWYSKDKGLVYKEVLKDPSKIQSEELAVYFQLAFNYISNLYMTLKTVTDNIDAAKEENHEQVL